jgi:hypothetical protein
MGSVEGRRRRYVGFAALMTLAALAAVYAITEQMGRRGLLPYSIEDVSVFVVEPLLQKRGDRLHTTPYAHLNSPAGSIAADPDDAWRAVALGGSFMFGDPYGEPGEPLAPGGIPFWLGEVLQQGADRPVDVLDLGGLGDTSIRVREKALSVVELDLDLLLVATGNNEFPLEPEPRRFFLRRFALVRLVSNLAHPTMVDGEAVERDVERPPDAQVKAAYRANLVAIADAAQGADVPLVLATLPANLLQGVMEGGGWQQPRAGCVGHLAAELEAGDTPMAVWADALARVAEGEEPADRGPLSMTNPCLLQGLIAWRDGRPGEALQALQDCPEADILPSLGVALAAQGRPEAGRMMLEPWTESTDLGIRPSYNDVVREVAASRPEVLLVDLEQAVHGRAELGLPGPPLFVDSCHMHHSAYGWLAGRIAADLREAGLAPGEGPIPDASLDELAARHGLDPIGPSQLSIPAADPSACPHLGPMPEPEP